MKTLTKIILSVFLLWTMVYGLRIVNAAVPHLINYQGRLTDTSGTPLNGSYNLTFRIYDTESAGNLLWEEAQSGVVIQKGIFSVLLGSVTNLNLTFDKPYWLEIKVGSEVMSPRQRIASVGYAFMAEKAEEAKIKSDSSDVIAGYLSDKIDGSTIEVNSSHKLQIKNGGLTPEKFANTVAGETVEASALTERNTLPITYMTYTKIKEISLGRNGNIRVKFQLKTNNPSFAAYAQIYKNGAAIGTERSATSINYIEYSEDINNLAAGDLIQLYIKSAGATAYARNFRVCVANPMVSASSVD